MPSPASPAWPVHTPPPPPALSSAQADSVLCTWSHDLSNTSSGPLCQCPANPALMHSHTHAHADLRFTHGYVHVHAQACTTMRTCIKASARACTLYTNTCTHLNTWVTHLHICMLGDVNTHTPLDSGNTKFLLLSWAPTRVSVPWILTQAPFSTPLRTQGPHQHALKMHLEIIWSIKNESN